LEQKAQLSKTCNMQSNSKLNSIKVSGKKEITSIEVEVIEILYFIKITIINLKYADNSR